MTRAVEAPSALGMPDEAVDLAGDADQRIHRLAIAHARKLQRDGEAEVGDERERMRRIDGERSEQGKNLPQELIFEPGLFLFRHLRPIDQHDASGGEHLPQLVPALLLIARQHRDGLSDARELLGRGEPVRRLDRDAGPLLALEAGDAHHEEFVEVVGRDRQEADTFEQRMGIVRRLLEHPAIEVQP